MPAVLEPAVARRAAVEARLERALAPEACPTALSAAMREAVFPGGKRWRPALTLAAAELCGAGWRRALGSAAAVELIHSASLVFDDLPCMDDALLRRGRPALHLRHGTGLAVLAGLGLLTSAYGLLARAGGAEGRAVRVASRHLGSAGMLGGQAVDLAVRGHASSGTRIVPLLYRKTSALVVLSLQLGALHGSPRPREWRALTRFGRDLGEAFQALDDLRDGDHPRLLPAEAPGRRLERALEGLRAAFPAAGAPLEGLVAGVRALAERAPAAVGGAATPPAAD